MFCVAFGVLHPYMFCGMYHRIFIGCPRQCYLCLDVFFYKLAAWYRHYPSREAVYARQQALFTCGVCVHVHQFFLQLLLYTDEFPPVYVPWLFFIWLSSLVPLARRKNNKKNVQYGIANIPPVVMFNAKIFKPSRLCAVYKVEGLSENAREVLKERVLRLRYVRSYRCTTFVTAALHYLSTTTCLMLSCSPRRKPGLDSSQRCLVRRPVSCREHIQRNSS